MLYKKKSLFFFYLFGFNYSISCLGLAGKLYSNLDDSLGGEYPSMDDNDLLAIDREGRAIMTEHELE